LAEQRSRFAIVTGCSNGIGLAIAQAFKREGWQTAGVDLAPVPDGVCDLFVAGSVSDASILNKLHSELAGAAAATCCLVNNAAFGTAKTFLETSAEEWDRCLATNLSPVFHFTQKLQPMLENGSVINISSIHARATSVGAVAYATSKGGLSALTRALALELAPFGTRVNAILPGAIETAMLRGNMAYEENPEAALQFLRDRTPLKRIGQPHEIAELALFLADSSKAGNITGQEFICDGGAMARLSTE
jgi:NAD(P)-dependent dehydrogenase (short-subunit alcohol dehydrogenase family)